MSSARELYKIYKLRVLPIPTNKPPIRKQLPTMIFGTMEAKERAVVEEIRQAGETQRPVLVGTRSIDKSMRLSKLLKDAGIEHRVLTSHQVDKKPRSWQAQVAGPRTGINQYGRPRHRYSPGRRRGRVGRLLLVVCTEMHDAARIDRQLIGRAAGKAIRGPSGNSSPWTTTFC